MKGAAVLVAAIVAAVCLTDLPSRATGDDAIPGPPGVEVLVSGRALGPEVPADFLGLSFETTALHNDEFAPDRPVLAQLFANLGPGLVRFGGNTLDHSAWGPAGRFPGATSVVTPADVTQMFGFARRVGWKVLLGLDLGHYDSAVAADEAATVSRLGGATLAAFEFGNEPDLYIRSYAGALRPSGYDVAQYLQEWQAYLRAVRQRVPEAKVVGPGIAGIPGSLDMLRQFAETEHNEIAFATSHHYPLGAPIADPHSPAYPSIANLLSPSLSRRDREEVGSWMRTIADAGVSLRLTETNSVFGGGKNGVSDTLAGALWTVDYLFRVAELGMRGINLHTTLDQCGGYTPICAPTLADAQADRFHVQPNYYALLLFHTAAQGRFMPTRVSDDPHVTAYATRRSDGVTRIIVINLGEQSTRTRVRVLGLPPGTDGSLVRLLGPSLATTDGVTFARHPVAANGTWHPGLAETVPASRDTVQILLPPTSATVLTLAPRHTTSCHIPPSASGRTSAAVESAGDLDRHVRTLCDGFAPTRHRRLPSGPLHVAAS